MSRLQSTRFIHTPFHKYSFASVIFRHLTVLLVHERSRERAILAGVIFVTLLAQVLLYPGVPDLVEALGATTDLDASMWFLAVEFSAFILFAGIWGALSDRLGRRVPLIALGAAIAAICYFTLAGIGSRWSVSFETVLAIRAIQGAGTIAAFSLAMTMLMDLEGGHGRNMGAAGIAIGSGTALGAPVGGGLYELGALFPLVAAGFLFALIIPLLLVVRDRAPVRTGSRLRALVSDLRRYPALSLPYAFGFVDRMTAGTFSLVGVFFFTDEFGLDPGAVGLFLMLFFAPFALLQYPFGAVSDRIGRFGPVVIGSICYGLAVASVGQSSTLVIAGTAMLIVGVFGAVVSPATMALVTDITPEDRRGTAMAGFNVAGSLGFLAGIVVGGLIADAVGYDIAFAAIGGLEILIALVAIPVFIRLSPRLPGIAQPTIRR